MEDGQNLLPGVPPELVNKTLNTELKFNPNYYRIWTSDEILAAEDQAGYEIEDPLSASPVPRVSDGSMLRK